LADNYVLFSEVLPALNRKEQAWVTRLLTGSCEDWAAELAAAGIDIDPDDEVWPGFQWEILAARRSDLWLYTDESGNVRHVTQFVKALLHRFRPKDSWSMTWAEICSRPRIGEFGGGSAFVTSRGVQFHNAHQWVAKRASLFASKARKAKPPRKA